MSAFIRSLVQLPGEAEPTPHYALVFDDVVTPEDFVSYRDALLSAAKTILGMDDPGTLSEEAYWLVQMAEFIDASLDQEHNRETHDSQSPLNVYKRHIARVNNNLFKKHLTT